MACGCQKDFAGAEKLLSSRCRFCTPTSVWWAPHKSCYAWRCSNPAMLTDPPEWAFGNTRRATEGDSPHGAVLEGADYIAVRSCFCRCDRCKHFELQEGANDG